MYHSDSKISIWNFYHCSCRPNFQYGNWNTRRFDVLLIVITLSHTFNALWCVSSFWLHIGSVVERFMSAFINIDKMSIMSYLNERSESDWKCDHHNESRSRMNRRLIISKLLYVDCQLTMKSRTHTSCCCYCCCCCTVKVLSHRMRRGTVYYGATRRLMRCRMVPHSNGAGVNEPLDLSLKTHVLTTMQCSALGLPQTSACELLKTQQVLASLCCKSHRYKTANVKILSTK